MRTRPSGFTLVEVMVVVTIIGVLASVAIPSYREFQLRSRQAERAVVMESVRAAIEDFYLKEGRFPQDWGGGMSGIWLSANPSWTLSTQRRPFRTVSLGDDWNRLSITIDGGLFYNYWANGQVFGGTRQYWIIADGDLDGDGAANTMQRLYQYQADQLQTFPGADPRCKCTWNWEWPADESTY